MRPNIFETGPECLLDNFGLQSQTCLWTKTLLNVCENTSGFFLYFLLLHMVCTFNNTNRSVHSLLKLGEAFSPQPTPPPVLFKANARSILVHKDPIARG